MNKWSKKAKLEFCIHQSLMVLEFLMAINVEMMNICEYDPLFTGNLLYRQWLRARIFSLLFVIMALGWLR